MPLNSFPRPHCCLPLFNLFSLLFISIPISPVVFFFNAKGETVEPRGAETEAGESGIDSATRRQTGDVVKEVDRCAAAFLCLTRCGQASVSCYIRQLTGSYSSVGWDLAQWPIQEQSKDHL